MDDNSELDYISSVDPYVAQSVKPSVDTEDEKALERIQKALDGQIKVYHTISGMKLFPKEFTADQREAMCNQFVQLLSSLQLLITNAIDGVKEAQQNGRR